MKIPLVYPKIPDGRNCPLKKCIAFEKYDGTNIHFIWTPEMSFIGFGTRRDRFDTNYKGNKDFANAHLGLEEVVYEIKFNAYLQSLDTYLSVKYNNVKEIIIFTEFLGDKSFAGTHYPNDEKRLILLDVMVGGRMLPPENLIKDFSKFNLAKIIYKGKYTGQFVEDVRKGKYPVNEGVVVKGVVDGQVYMTKIKTDAYMKRLQTEFKDNWKDYWE